MYINIKVNRKAFTLVELLVVLAVIGVLVGLIIPAVQWAREASRRSQCASNLRQIGIALNAYNGAFGVLPMSHNGEGYSPHVVMLPFLEQAAFYNNIDMSEKFTGGSRPSLSTAMSITLSVYLCPSDSGGPSGRGYTNYPGNRGFGYNDAGNFNNGVFNQPVRSSPASFAGITDGTSSTAAFTEWLVGPVSEGRTPNRIIYRTSPLAKAGEFDQFIAECQGSHAQPIPGPTTGKGLDWMHGDLRSSLYNHNNIINGHSCINGTKVQQGAWTAGSLHTHGANTLFVDGHVTFLSDSITPMVWRAIGTRDGGETVTLD